MKSIELKEFAVSSAGSVDPSKHSTELFDLYSIPAYDKYIPDILRGSEIGSIKKIVQPNDVLLSRIVPHIRRVWVVGPAKGRRQIASGEWIIFRGGSYDPQYLRHFLMSDLFHQQFMQTIAGVGGSLLRARPAEVGKIIIPLPLISEQRRIASILDKSDAIRYKWQGIINLSSVFLRSVFLEMFGDPFTNSKRWVVDQLGNRLSFITSGSRGWAKYYSPNGLRFIRSYDVQMNQISDTDAVFVQPPLNAESQRTKVKDGDVLLTITGSRIGRVAPVLERSEEAYVSQHVAILRLNGSLVPHYLSMFLSDPRGGQHQIKRLQYGQTKPGINLEQIREIKLPCPPRDLQDRFRTIWELHAKILRKQQLQQQRCIDLCGSLTQRAFRGEL